MDPHHTPYLSPNQCGSSLVRTIGAPLPLVWSMVRRFDNPQTYKRFIKSCTLIPAAAVCGGAVAGAGVGSVREVSVVSGLPAGKSTERLDRLDDETHVMVFSIIGGDHRLVNYRSITTLHEEESGGGGGGRGTVVVESYVVDVPVGSSKEDTCLFADTIIGCNLKSLADISEKIFASNNV